MNDKRNAGIVQGDGESDESHLRRLDEYISKLEWQSEGHRMWYTHKNPYGCWICELLQVIRECRNHVSLDTGGDEPDEGEEYNIDDEK